VRLIVAVFVAGSCPAAAQPTPGDLARARTYYNQRQFDEAIDAAAAARKVPETADAAALVLARAHLERYRQRADPADLKAAREALGVIRAEALERRDHVEMLLAMGQSLFLEDDFGAAATMFESGVDAAADADRDLGEAMLEWWGSAVERHAGSLSRHERTSAFSRVADRMREQLGRHPTSAAACYWIVAALRGAGESQRAWDAAVAGYVRARLMGARAAALRADLDRLVIQGIIPDRVRDVPKEERAAAESQLKADWELVKEKWK
jgi:hypothetical protein